MSIKPLRWLCKFEVREVGRLLGVPDNILYKHPFPSWGYARKIEGNITCDSLSFVKELDVTLIEGLKRSSLYSPLKNAFASVVNYEDGYEVGLGIEMGGFTDSLALEECLSGIANDMHQRFHDKIKDIKISIDGKWKCIPSLERHHESL